MDHVLNFWRERWAEADSNLGPSAADGMANSSIQGRPAHHHTGKRQRDIFFNIFFFIIYFVTIFILIGGHVWNCSFMRSSFYSWYLLPISIVFWLSQPRSVSLKFLPRLPRSEVSIPRPVSARPIQSRSERNVSWSKLHRFTLTTEYLISDMDMKYLISDMVKCYCLRVSRRKVRRIGKHSPSFSVFPSGVHGSADSVLFVFRSRASSERFFIMNINPSLPQPVKCPCWKVHTYTHADRVFDGPVANLLSVLCILMEILWRAHAKEGKASVISNFHFCWSLSEWRCCKHGSERVNISHARQLIDKDWGGLEVDTPLVSSGGRCLQWLREVLRLPLPRSRCPSPSTHWWRPARQWTVVRQVAVFAESKSSEDGMIIFISTSGATARKPLFKESEILPAKVEIKNESIDRQVYKKTFAEAFTSQYTGETSFQPYDQLEV